MSLKFKSSWEKVGNPDTDSWDAFDYVAKEGPEYLDQCNGHTDEIGRLSLSRHRNVALHHRLLCGRAAGDAQPRTAAASSQREPVRPRGRGGARAGGRPGPEQVSQAAAALGMDAGKVAEALRVEDRKHQTGGTRPPPARTLGVAETALREALGGGGNRPPRANQNPAGEPECFFRCGQSDEDRGGLHVDARAQGRLPPPLRRQQVRVA